MKIKKYISILLTVCMLVSTTTITSFADVTKEISNNVNKTYSASELKKIEDERQALYDDIKMQLEAQNSVDKFEYFKPIADNQINSKYYPQPQSSRISYYAPRGGNITSKDGALESVAEFMTAQNANNLYIKAKEVGLQEFITGLAVIGVGLKWTIPGAYISAVQIFGAFSNKILWASINKGKDNVIIYSVYDGLDVKTTTVINVWSDYPYMSDKVSFGKNIAHQTY